MIYWDSPRIYKHSGNNETLDFFTVKPFLIGHSKIDETKILKPCGSLMQVESTAECSTGAFCITFDLH